MPIFQHNSEGIEVCASMVQPLVLLKTTTWIDTSLDQLLDLTILCLATKLQVLYVYHFMASTYILYWFYVFVGFIVHNTMVNLMVQLKHMWYQVWCSKGERFCLLAAPLKSGSVYPLLVTKYTDLLLHVIRNAIVQ